MIGIAQLLAAAAVQTMKTTVQGKNSQGLDHIGFAAGKRAWTACNLLKVTARFKAQASMTQSVSKKYENGIVWRM